MPEYIFLLKPHENVRYQQSALKLSEQEMRCMLSSRGLEPRVRAGRFASADYLEVSLDEDCGNLLPFLCTLSCLYLAVIKKQEGFEPVAADVPSFVPAYMPGVEKYKGKTSPAFTRLLINLALSASRARQPEMLLLDPVCGRGTTLFTALTMGISCTGLDRDKNDIAEGIRFAKSFFQYEKISFQTENSSRTLKKGSAPQTTFRIKGAEQVREMSFLCADTRDCVPAVKKGSFSLLVADLPYGVQHAPLENKKTDSFAGLLHDALPVWHQALAPGGAAVLAFNRYTLKREALADDLTKAGFCVLGPPYEGFEHWVEQAIMRDLIVARA